MATPRYRESGVLKFAGEPVRNSDGVLRLYIFVLLENPPLVQFFTGGVRHDGGTGRRGDGETGQGTSTTCAENYRGVALCSWLLGACMQYSSKSQELGAKSQLVPLRAENYRLLEPL